MGIKRRKNENDVPRVFSITEAIEENKSKKKAVVGKEVTPESLEPETFRVKALGSGDGEGLTMESVAKALIACDGFITRAAQVVGVHYTTLRRFIKGSEKIQKLIEDINESLIDLAESQLRVAIRSGNMTAILFTLKCKGKGRGWIEDGSIIPKEDKPITFKYKSVSAEKKVAGGKK